MAEPGVTRIIALTLGEKMSDSNPVAAMPSLHVALPLTIAAWCYKERWTAPAWAMLAYSGLVASEVVFSGEHYVIDVAGAGVAAGLIYLIASIDARLLFAAVRRLAPRRAIRDGGEAHAPVWLSEPAFSDVSATGGIAVSRQPARGSVYPGGNS